MSTSNRDHSDSTDEVHQEMDKELSDLLYKKRGGTSGASGQLYETKLISLILFRLQHDDDVEQFCLGTNVDGLGVFDDICFIFKTKHHSKPIAVFLQSKHRDNQRRPLVVNALDLKNFFLSYLTIRNKFNVDNTDAIFRRIAYDEVECVFVFYTNNTHELKYSIADNDIISKINNIVGTGDDAFKLSYKNAEINLLNTLVLNEKISKLAALVANIVGNKEYDYNNIMKEELIQTYHVLLSQKVFHVSEIQPEGHRLGYFREDDDFFKTTDQHILLLKETLFLEMLKQTKLDEEETKKCFSSLFIKPNEDNISKLIGHAIMYNNNKFEFVDKNMNGDIKSKEKLENIKVARSVVAAAVDAAGKSKLCSSSFKLPPEFGNKDISVREDNEHRDDPLNDLANEVVKLLEDAKELDDTEKKCKVVVLDESFCDKAFPRIDLVGAVGNLFVADETTNLLMFNKADCLEGNAKMLLEIIHGKVEELDCYRFDVKVQYFPKLTFVCNEDDKAMVLDFCNKMLFYTNQATQSKVEDMLKKYISRLQNTRERGIFQIKSDAIFVTYHDEVLKWWMNQTNAEYLTTSNTFFQNATHNFIMNPLLSVANVIARNKIIRNDVIFDTKPNPSLEIITATSKAIIVSRVIALTVMKLIQYFNHVDFTILDINYILNLPANDSCQLDDEMRSSGDRYFIVTCDTDSQISIRDIKDILQSLEDKRVILVTNEQSAEIVKKCFNHAEITDTITLENLTPECQIKILGDSNVMFQDVAVSLNSLLDDDSKLFIKEELMKKIINRENIMLGKSLMNENYEESKPYYVSRKVIKFDGTEINVGSFDDIEDRVVLVKAEPGMGKSLLLTHLSLTTKQRNPKVWIIRIDLLEYSRYFQWQQDKVTIDILEALTLLCTVLFIGKSNKKIVLKEEESEVCLDERTEIKDQQLLFEINMFLHYYNKFKVIFAFDGFDEVCPHYREEVITFLTVIKSSRNREHRMWVTSRAYNEILNSLELNFGEPYLIKPFRFQDVGEFISKFLKAKLNFNDINSEHIINKIKEFMTFISHWRHIRNRGRGRGYLITTVEVMVGPFSGSNPHSIDMKDAGSWNINKNLQLIQVPLHIYMIVDYFQNEIKDSQSQLKWNWNSFDTSVMYERFVETKLKKILFEDKNRVEWYRPGVQDMFERERKEFLNQHKILAAYAMFLHFAVILFSEIELNYIKLIINSIKSGGEKTGFICYVVDDIPRFVHLAFAEYFAAKYITDILKAEQSGDKVKLLWNFILNDKCNYNIGVLNRFDADLGTDDQLKTVVNSEDNKRTIFDIILTQCGSKNSFLWVTVNGNLWNLTKLLVSTLEFLNENNIHDVVRIVDESDVMIGASMANQTELFNTVLNIVKSADATILGGFSKHLNIDWSRTNEEIIRTFQRLTQP